RGRLRDREEPRRQHHVDLVVDLVRLRAGERCVAGRAVRARAIGGLLALAARALGAADGDLDPSFSGDGKLVVAWESSGSAQAVAAAPDGDVAVAGVVSSEWAVSRVNADGSLDVAWAIGFETFDFAAAGASDTDDVYAARFDP